MKTGGDDDGSAAGCSGASGVCSKQGQIRHRIQRTILMQIAIQQMREWLAQELRLIAPINFSAQP
jgi:hypothetical protein